MRLRNLLAATAAVALCSGAAMAQTADVSHSSTPSTNDPTTRTDDECGANKGPKPCGAQIIAVPIPDDSGGYVEQAPAAETSTTEVYMSAPSASPEVRTVVVTNGPVPDTPENRARFGGPESNGGRNTRPVGN